jgi:sugar O-acyltransferase (sialic acid O-acetyltransferase NeuD family)
MRKLVIFGIGKIGQVVYPHFAQDSDYTVAGFTVERQYVPPEGQYDGLTVVAFEEVQRHFPPQNHDMFIGIGYHNLNRARANLCAAAKAKGYQLASYLSSANRHVARAQMGENCFVMSGEPLQPQSRIGNNCFVWTNALVGHHAQAGDHCWITSGVVIGGNSRVGDGCFLGLNATIGHEISVGAYSIIGAGALVVKDAPEKTVCIAAETPRFRLNSDQFLKMKPF